MAVLEREGRFSPSSASSSSSSCPGLAPSSTSETTAEAAAAAAAAAGAGGAGGAGGGGGREGGCWWSSPEAGVDFQRFVAAVQAVFLFEGFYREARQAFLQVTGRVDGPAPLDELLARLFPGDNLAESRDSNNHDDYDGNNRRSTGRPSCGGEVREAIRERLDVGRRGETKVRLSTLTDCVLSSSFHT
ncbi:unnamed protein product [Pylaiella littoralis]